MADQPAPAAPGLFERQATKKAAKARIGIYGVSGSGKTWTALLIAEVLANGGKIGALDTEAGSMSKYADRFAFFPATMKKPFSPDRFVQFVDAANASDIDVLVIDGASPFWEGVGGILAIVDESRARSSSGGWKDGTPQQQRIVEAIVNCRPHVIVTMRAKSDSSPVKDERTGKVSVRKIGLKPTQRDGFEYEFDFLLYLDQDHSATIEKARMHGQVGLRIDADHDAEVQPIVTWARDVAAWLSEGVADDPPPVAPVTPPTVTPATPPPATPAADLTGGLAEPPPPTPAEAPPAAAPRAEAEPTPAGAPSPEREAARGRIAAAMEGLRALNPNRQWADEVSAKLPEWYGGKTAERALDDVEAANLADRLEAILEVSRANAAQA